MRYDRFDFLMNLTNTRNTELGKALVFDSSYISKIRTGQRKPPQNSDFTEQASGFLAKKLIQGYQLRAASDAICPGEPLPEDRGELAALICSWLMENPENDDSGVRNILQEISAIPEIVKKVAKGLESAREISPARTVSWGTYFYYGDEGKREAILRFLTELASKPYTGELLFYSDEDLSWLIDDVDFSAKWAVLILKLMDCGAKIRIIHNVRRNINDLFLAVKKWLPLYSTGGIEPYYYPLIHDGIFHRSLFIAPGVGALVSSSVTDHTDGMANILTFDEDAIDAFVTEFENFFGLCRPLMRIFRNSDRAECIRFVREFVSDKNAAILCADPASSPSDIPGLCSVISKENGGSVITFGSPVSVAFAIEEQNISDAFFQYLQRVTPRGTNTSKILDRILRNL